MFYRGPQWGEVHLGVQDRETERLGLATKRLTSVTVFQSNQVLIGHSLQQCNAEWFFIPFVL